MLRLKEKIYIAQKKIKEEIEWDKVINCGTKPDPSDDQDLNTFMSLYTQPSQVDKFSDIPAFLEKMQFSENVIPTIKFQFLIIIYLRPFKG